MNNMMRKNNNRGGNKHRGGGGGGGRRYQNHGGNRSNGGGNDHQNLSRQKHHATQMREKFANMARDAQNNGDRVDVEYYLQHVDHYTRVLTDIAAIEAERFAHQREQHQSQPANEGGEANEAAPENHTPELQPYGSTQPRMTRQPRHQAAPAAVDSGSAPTEAADESSNHEIPLPGLPTI